MSDKDFEICDMLGNFKKREFVKSANFETTNIGRRFLVAQRILVV